MDENTNELMSTDDVSDNTDSELSGNTVECLDCESSVALPDNPEVGDVLVCENCGVELEIIETEPEVEVDYLMIEK